MWLFLSAPPVSPRRYTEKKFTFLPSKTSFFCFLDLFVLLVDPFSLDGYLTACFVVASKCWFLLMFLGILLVYGVCLVYLGWFDFEWCKHRVRPLELLRLLWSWCFPSFLLCDPGLPWCPIGSRSMLIRFRYMNKLKFSDIGFSTFSKNFFFFCLLKNANVSAYEDEQFENTDLKMLTKNDRSIITYWKF